MPHPIKKRTIALECIYVTVDMQCKHGESFAKPNVILVQSWKPTI
jgi:hypothetical protein